ncbi:MAG TPA: hypothetical protein VJN70_17835 [Gemmatimonadaceae bacterium]|nr:hypothetical protein [Gemmatimonadaceae bacterium]
MRRYVLASLAMLLIACGGDKAVGPETIAGTYTLQTVNGNKVPAAFYQDSLERDEFISGNVVLADDHSWSGQLGLRGTDLTTNQPYINITAPVGGTFSLKGGQITLSDVFNGLVFTGTVGGGTLSIGTDIGAGATTALVFQK